MPIMKRSINIAVTLPNRKNAASVLSIGFSIYTGYGTESCLALCKESILSRYLLRLSLYDL